MQKEFYDANQHFKDADMFQNKNTTTLSFNSNLTLYPRACPGQVMYLKFKEVNLFFSGSPFHH